MKCVKTIIFLFFIQLSTIGFTQDYDNTLNKLIDETQKDVGGSDGINLVWWMPYEFWELSLKSDPSFPKDEIKSFVDVLKPYSIFAIVDGKIGPFGGVEYISFESINNSIVLVDNEGNEYKPLNNDEINADVQNLLVIFKPLVQNLIGPMGENMHFFIFSDLNKKTRISDPRTEGIVQVNYTEREIKWETPLSSLLPPKFCPVDNKKVEGDWIYCPWHGKKLLENKNED